jgi:hypothetical protein
MCVASVTVVAGARVSGVRWDEPLDDALDSGFSCWSNEDNFDALSEDEFTARLATTCLRCLIEHHPEAGVLLDRARDAPDHIALAEN